MTVSGYELRTQLLIEAKNMLMDDYSTRREVEFRNAERESRASKTIPLPASAEIVKLAEELYEFVQQRS
jgi:hypothetical protein